jgi:hypothetical protein
MSSNITRYITSLYIKKFIPYFVYKDGWQHTKEIPSWTGMKMVNYHRLSISQDSLKIIQYLYRRKGTIKWETKKKNI